LRSNRRHDRPVAQRHHRCGWSLTDDNEFICIEGFKDTDAGTAHVSQPYVKRFFEVAPDLVAAQPQIIYIDTPHDGFGPMGEIQPR
jgi:quinol monooxygenase YgiN